MNFLIKELIIVALCGKTIVVIQSMQIFKSKLGNVPVSPFTKWLW